MEVICLETEAFYTLVEQVVRRIKEETKQPIDPWLDTEEAMKLLGISSKTTLQKLRDSNAIKFSKVTQKNIQYSRQSILDYLDNKAEEVVS